MKQSKTAERSGNTMAKTDQFFTDNYLILSYLCNIRDFDNIAHVTQQELANGFEMSRATVNKIISDLRLSGYIKPDGRHLGRYVISKEAIRIVETMRSIEEDN
jgi:DNA-binding IclR family transcriptional regulator